MRRLVWTYLTVSLQRDASGKPAYCIAVVQDISERKRLEAELMQAKEAAEAANRAKDEFLANVSHEIRTPMNAILGMTELALDTPLTEDQRQCLKTVKSAADNLLGIINDLLDFSKIEAGKLELDPADFSLRAALGDTLRALAVRAHKKGLELVSHVQPDVPDALVGDAGRLRQVLLNLVGNAIKFTEEGEVVVRVEVAGRAVARRGEVGLRFTVSDTGIGIPHEKQETIFRAFEQEDTSTTRQVRRHRAGPDDRRPAGGPDGRDDHCGERAGPGQHVRLHGAVRAPAAPAGAGRRPAAGPAPQPAACSSWTTTPPTARSWRSGCAAGRWSPMAVGDGAGGPGRPLAGAANGQPYPLVLLDSRMPDTDGLTLAARSGSGPSLSATRIILLTSGDRPGDLARFRELRIDAHLLKPVQQEELLETIYQVMSRPPQGRHTDGETACARAKIQRPRLRGPRPRHRCTSWWPRTTSSARNSWSNCSSGRATACVWRATAGRRWPSRKKAHFDLLLLDVHMPELDGFQVVQAIRSGADGRPWRTCARHCPSFGRRGRERRTASGASRPAWTIS